MPCRKAPALRNSALASGPSPFWKANPEPSPGWATTRGISHSTSYPQDDLGRVTGKEAIRALAHLTDLLKMLNDDFRVLDVRGDIGDH